MASSGRKSGGRGSERSAKNLSAAAAQLKLSIGKLKEIASGARYLGEERLAEMIKKEVRKQKQKEIEDNPSELVRHSVARQVQFQTEGSPRFICYRGPPEASPSIPLALVDRRFFDFRLNATATSQVEEADLDTAHHLWKLCSQGWDDEGTQMTPDVNELFQKYLRRFVDNRRADGVVDGMMVLFEHKLHPADGYFQGLEYFRRRFVSSKESGFPLSYGLLILVACPHIQAVAVVMDWEAEKVAAEPLTGFVNCFGPQQFDDVLLLAATLRAVRLFCSQYRPEDVVDPAVPFVFKTKPAKQLKDRLVFVLDPDRVAKLTKSYSEEAHRLWAEENVAPPLYNVLQIGGGWMLVEMAYLGTMDGWRDAKQVVSECAGDPEALAKLTESIRTAAAKGHSTGYVHGDMRLPNIKLRCRSGVVDVMFIDFDWAGKAGQATYPVLLNPDVGWHKDAGFGRPIQPEHDLHFVQTLVAQLKD